MSDHEFIAKVIMFLACCVIAAIGSGFFHHDED